MKFSSKLFVVIVAAVLAYGATVPAVLAAGNTYYIDYGSGSDTNLGTSKAAPWKRAPGMAGFAGTYVHNEGDTFVFKGGQTWPYETLPMYITKSGGAGNPDTYTSDTSWYSGSSWTKPIFDGGQQYPGSVTTLGLNSFLIGNNSSPGYSNILVENLQVQNVGAPSDGSGTGIQFVGGSSIEIRNVTFIPHSAQAFAYTNSTGGTTSHIYIHDNDISYAGRGVIYGWPGSLVDDVQVYNNNWLGLTNPYGAFHGDGLMVGCPAYCTADLGPTMTNISFHDNKFYGLWTGRATAQFYSNGNTSNTKVYNNIFSVENIACPSACISPAFLYFGKYDSNIYVYNNTFSSDSDPGYGHGTLSASITIGTAPSGTLVIKNNIFSGTGNDVIYTPAFSSVDIDYNLHNPSTISGYGNWIWANSPGTRPCNSLASCQADGFETHTTVSGDPKFVRIASDTIGSGDWHLTSASPALGKGVNLSGVFSADKDKKARPSSGSWDLGAYQYSVTTSPAVPPPVAPPASPSGGGSTPASVPAQQTPVVAVAPPASVPSASFPGYSGSQMQIITVPRVFTRSLTLGSTGADVKALQQLLNSAGFTVAISGTGSPGRESSYFGSLTRAALARYQAAHGIKPSFGYFGPITRAYIAAH